MSDNNAPKTGETKENANPPEGHEKPVVPWPIWKTVVLIAIALVSIGLVTNATIRFNANEKTGSVTQRPPPTYTGEAPPAITSIQDAWNSNNDFVMVFTPCNDAALNSSILSVTVQAADKIRSTDGIYVGVFTLPANNSLTYPTLTIRLFNTTASSLQFTMKADINADSIYNAYLDRKFLRG
jgi:hypothetical protein